MPGPVFSQQKSGTPSSKPVALIHVPPKPEAFPYPGQTMNLVVRLNNTRNTGQKMRLLLVKDGRLMNIPPQEGFLNEHDQPTYEIPVPAPIAEMVYQFILPNPDGSTLISPRYSIRRNCIPNIDLAGTEPAAEVQGIERLQNLVNQAKDLENDLATYDRIAKVLEQIKGLIE